MLMVHWISSLKLIAGLVTGLWLFNSMRACVIFVQLDLPLSEVFYKWMLGQEPTLQTDSLSNICPVLARSLSQLYDVARQRRRIEADKSHVWIFMCCQFKTGQN
jgi:hypothetical protein